MSTERNTHQGRLSYRRLTARSVLLSVLLGSGDAYLPTPLLLSTTALFGIADGTARTALSRMTATGDVVPTGSGYRISSPDLLARQARQSTGRSGATRDWTGDWVQVIVGLGERRSAAERSGVRATLTSARFGELREGVWLRPDNLVESPELGRLPADTLISTISSLGTDPERLTESLWDLHGWALDAADLIAAMSPLTARLEADDHEALADGFVLNAAVLRHVAADPLIPAALLPDGWPGTNLRRSYERFDAAFRTVIQAHFERHGADPSTSRAVVSAPTP